MPRTPPRRVLWATLDTDLGAFLVRRTGHTHPWVVVFVRLPSSPLTATFHCHERTGRVDVLDRSPKGAVIRIRFGRPSPFDDWVTFSAGASRYLYVVDASTKTPHLLQVPPTVRGVTAALAWSFRVPEKDYRPRVER